jgi:hypothetical protein
MKREFLDYLIQVFAAVWLLEMGRIVGIMHGLRR